MNRRSSLAASRAKCGESCGMRRNLHPAPQCCGKRPISKRITRHNRDLITEQALGVAVEQRRFAFRAQMERTNQLDMGALIDPG